jgi:RNA-binding protein PNO1
MEVDSGVTFHPIDVAAAAEAEMMEEDRAEEAAAAQSNPARPDFPALSAQKMRKGGASDFRRVRCPPHRLTPLRNNWEHIVAPVVEHMKLQIR